MKLIIIAPIILLMLAGCGGKSVKSIVGGPGALHLVKNIQLCEAYRVDDAYPGESEAVFNKKIHGYGVVSGPVNLDVPDKALLSQALVDSKTYVHYSEPIDCLFRPGVAFRFSDASNELNLLICFSCNELKYFSTDGEVGGSYFRSMKIKKLAKKLFPEDSEIQSLK
jgi:hypothetical protein